MMPYKGGYYTCNNYMKDAAEGTLVGEAKSAHDAEAIALACKKEGTSSLSCTQIFWYKHLPFFHYCIVCIVTVRQLSFVVL